MSEALAPSNLPANLEDFAAQNGLTAQEAMALLTDPNAAKRMQEITKWRARVEFHGRGIQRLIAIANGENDKQALSAINLLGKLAGEFKAPKIQIGFDSLLKQAASASAGPLTGITQIREAEVIDADDADDDDNE